MGNNFSIVTVTPPSVSDCRREAHTPHQPGQDNQNIPSRTLQSPAASPITTNQMPGSWPVQEMASEAHSPLQAFMAAGRGRQHVLLQQQERRSIEQALNVDPNRLPKKVREALTPQDLKAKYVPQLPAPRSLAFAIRMLNRVSLCPNPAIVEMSDSVFLLTTITGKEQPPFRFKRGDYFQCLEDAGLSLKDSLEKRCDPFFGNTALMNAIFNDNEDNAIALAIKCAEHGVPVDIPDMAGKTPLMMAAVKNQNDLLACLFDVGENVFQTDAQGNNFMHFACMRGNVKALEAASAHLSLDDLRLLLTQPNSNGQTPGDLLGAEHDHELLSAKRTDPGTKQEFEGRFDAEFSIWPGRPESASCDMDRNVSGRSEEKCLREAVIEQRRGMQGALSTVLGSMG